MKVLVICQYYTPEPFRHPDFCEELVRRGHDVTVVTGVPNYPMGETYDGYRHGENRDEIINGVNVHRCHTIDRKKRAVRRFLNYYSFVVSSTTYIRKLKEEYDVVFVNQLSPIMMANAGIKYKKKHHKQMVLYCLDLWPESLCAGGVKRGSLIYKYFHKVSEKIYNQADKILITSKSFADYFENEFGITETEYLPQYAEAVFTPEQCKKEPDEYLDLMFAGNLGLTQSVSTIIEAAFLTKDIKNIRWHIVGDGSEYNSLKKQAEGLHNVFFYGRKPLEEMPYYYAMADVMLVTMQNNPIISLTLPGKVQTYMAAGKPIIGAIDGETSRVIGDACCGECCRANDAESLAKIVLQLENKNLEKLSFNSRLFYEKNFVKDNFINKLESIINDYIC